MVFGIFAPGFRQGSRFLVVLLAASLLLTSAPAVQAQVTAFRQAVAESASRDDDLAGFYRAREFEGIWTGNARSGVAMR